MKAIVSMAVAAVILGGASLATSAAQAADVTVAVNPGAPVIAFGYNDGYWDREHRWHEWRDRQEMARWRETNKEHFYEKRHVEMPGEGWRTERWWERH